MDELHPDRPIARSSAGPRRGALVVALAVAAAVLGACAPPPPQSGPVIGIYGDSISYQASPWSDVAVAAAGGRVVGLRFPGLAACDLVESVRRDLAKPEGQRPRVVVVSTVGNSLSNCMTAPNGKLAPYASPAFWSLYRAAITQIAEATARAGVPMVFTWGPSSAPHGEAFVDEQHLGLLAEDVAREHPHLVVAHVGAVVLDSSDAYQVWLPCAPDETTAEGCERGKVRIRVSSTNGHFYCPASEVLPNGWPRTCPVMSPGARRYGNELARVALDQLTPGSS
jgi:hypothetical protein